MLNEANVPLQDLIRRHYAWDEISHICEHKPHIIQLTIFPNGNTVLHEVCSIGSAPHSIVTQIASIWPDAALLRNKHGDSPLHIAARNSQQSSARVRFLVHLNHDALLYKNHAGQTPIGTACVSVAWLPVIEILVEACPFALVVRDQYGRSPIALLWLSYLKTVVGAIAVQNYIRNSGGVDGGMSRGLGRFWDKFRFCVLTAYPAILNNSASSIMQEPREIESNSDSEEQDEIRDDDHDHHANDDSLLLHAILAQNIRKGTNHQILAIALTNNPNLALIVDRCGQNPLHKLAAGTDILSVQVLLKKCPDCAKRTNRQGRLPLHIALQSWKETGNKHEEGKGQHRKWTKKVDLIVNAHVDALDIPDCGVAGSNFDGLYPFMIAACLDDISMTYEILSRRPTVLCYATCTS